MKQLLLVPIALIGGACMAQSYDYYSYSVPSCSGNSGTTIELFNSSASAQCSAIASSFLSYRACGWGGLRSYSVASSSLASDASGHVTGCAVTVREDYRDSGGAPVTIYHYLGQAIYEKPAIDRSPPIKPEPPGSCSPQLGNPILPLTGSKREVVDLGATLGGRFQLSYDTRPKAPSNDAGATFQGAAPPSFSELWQTSLHRKLLVQSAGTQRVHVGRGMGAWVTFASDGAGGYTTDNDIKDRLVAIGAGWRYFDAGGQSVENYDAGGRLLDIKSATGSSLVFTYSDAITPAAVAPTAGLLIKVQDQAGRTLQLVYEQPALASLAPRVTQMLDPSGQVTAFEYDGQGNLARITWPDLKSRRFVYENPNFSWALTGVIDEGDVRRSTFGYDADGRATSTESAGGVNRYVANWGSPPGRQVTRTFDGAAGVIWRDHTWTTPQGSAVVTPNGQTLTLDATNVQGAPRLAGSTQPAGSGCAASTSSQAFDANGNVTQKDDFNGVRACYAFDLTRNLQTARVEGLSNTATCAPLVAAGAALPAGSRKASTQWHPDWRMAVKTAEPRRLTTNVYNGQPDPFNGGAVASCAPAAAVLPDGKPIAVLCKRVEQATTDLDGSQGFAAALEAGVVNRVWQYTYNSVGQVLTSKDPLNNTTTNTYYTDTTADHTLGDLQQVQNALGQITRYTKYNAQGQVLQTVDANSVATDHVYDQRQRLKSTSVAGQTTTYDYWPNGLTKQVTQPDASFIAYEYDDAQRLRALKDNLGNRIEYTLDNAGNRTAEVIKDPAGTMRRQVSRTLDALGRVQQVIGRE